jgi:hypothetical protein
MLSVAMHAFNPLEACVQELVGRTSNAFQPVTGVRTITAASRDQEDEEPDSIDAVLVWRFSASRRRHRCRRRQPPGHRPRHAP